MLGLRRGVIALTTITANLRTGEIFDADIELDARDEDFTLTDSTTLGERNLHGGHLSSAPRGPNAAGPAWSVGPRPQTVL
jgi:hypothetical protein